MLQGINRYISLIPGVFLGLACSTAVAATEWVLNPNQPRVLTNSTNQAIVALCEVHFYSTQPHAISIQVLRGSGVFNGTTMNQGNSMLYVLKNLQVITLSGQPGVQAQFTNLGPNVIKATCN